MGLFDFFKSSPSQNAIRKQVQKAKEPYAQPDYRRQAMEKLLKWDLESSLKGLLERFSVVVQSPHWDEEEKRWLVGELIKKDEKIIPILKDFILNKNEINHALEALKKILNDDVSFGLFLIEALKKRPAIDHRSVQAKEELIKALAEIKPEGFQKLLVDYLSDHSDDVQCITLDALSDSTEPEILENMLKLLISEDHSARVLLKAAGIIAKRKIIIPEDIKLNPSVSEDYNIKNRLLIPR